MKKKYIPLLIVIAIVVLIIWFFSGYIKLRLPHNTKKAISLAEEYLKSNYTAEMQYEEIRIPIIDPVIYHVTFSVVDKPGLVIEVLVLPSFAIPEESVNQDGVRYLPDNYYMQVFKYETNKKLPELFEYIWTGDARSYMIVDQGALYAFRVPPEISENSNYDEMLQAFDYYISFDISFILDTQNKAAEAKKIFDAITIMKESDYKPDRILFWYQTGNKDKKYAFKFEDRAI